MGALVGARRTPVACDGEFWAGIGMFVVLHVAGASAHNRLVTRPLLERRTEEACGVVYSGVTQEMDGLGGADGLPEPAHPATT